MAKIVLAMGSSHSPLLGSPAEDYPKHAEIDAKGRKLLDKQGRPCTYGDLLAQADPRIADQVTPAAMSERAAKCDAAIAHISGVLAAARLDALIVIGDDQNEHYFEDNRPAVLVYWGQTIENKELQLPEDSPAFWKKARSQYHEPAQAREYPVAAELALHLIDDLMGHDFDISASQRLASGKGEGHAFGFVHRRLMRGDVVPIVPIALNAYFPPNQPRPARCYRLGQAIRHAVERWDGNARVAVIASGGLSHFTIDEELDREILQACRGKNATALRAIPAQQLQSGSSEIRNWIATAGAAEHLDVTWHEYVPCYRSPAGTGCGMGFAVWS